MSINLQTRKNNFEKTTLYFQSSDGINHEQFMPDLKCNMRFLKSPVFGLNQVQEYSGSSDQKVKSSMGVLTKIGREPFTLDAELSLWGEDGTDEEKIFNSYFERKSVIINILQNYDIFKIGNPHLEKQFSKFNTILPDMRWVLSGKNYNFSELEKGNGRILPYGTMTIQFKEISVLDQSDINKSKKSNTLLKNANKVNTTKITNNIVSNISYRVKNGDQFNQLISDLSNKYKVDKRQIKEAIINEKKNRDAIENRRNNQGKSWNLINGKTLYIPLKGGQL